MTILLVFGIVMIVVGAWISVHYHRCIRKGTCPICGAKIETYQDGRLTVHRCTECDWFKKVDEYGNDF